MPQAVAQLPQWLASVFVFTLQPLACKVLSQLANPDAHVPLQAPPVHVTGETLFDEHTVLQLPQLLTSVCVSTHPLVHI